MAPTVILIRHAQALHNAANPPLTRLGHRQCEDLHNHLQQHSDVAPKVELIVVSPMRRTLQTAGVGLQWLIDRGVPVQPRGEWQENSESPCDTGTPIRTIAEEFPAFSFDTVFPEYPIKSGRWAFTQEAVFQRAIDCRRWLKSRPEKVIAVVSHSAFLRLAVTNSQFANADYRVFDFADNGDAHDLVEWKLTVENGGGMGWSPKGPSKIQPSDFKMAVSQREFEKDESEVLGEVRSEAPAT